MQSAAKRAQLVIFRFQEIIKYRYKHVTKMAPSVSAHAVTCSSHMQVQ
jgi:hypothetical protein